MPTNSPKFQYPGIVPFPIEYEKTAAEIDQQFSRGGDFLGTLYPLGLSLDNFVKMYWRMKEINLSADISVDLRAGRPNGGCAVVGDEFLNIIDNKANLSINPSDPLDSLKQRVCELYSVDMQIKRVSNYYGNNSISEEEYAGTFSWCQPLYIGNNTFAPQVIAEHNGGNINDPNSYLYYPLINFGVFQAYVTNWSSFIAYDSSEQSPCNEQTINVTMDGASLGTVTIYCVESHTGPCPPDINANFGDWDIQLWDKPQ